MREKCRAGLGETAAKGPYILLHIVAYIHVRVQYFHMIYIVCMYRFEFLGNKG